MAAFASGAEGDTHPTSTGPFYSFQTNLGLGENRKQSPAVIRRALRSRSCVLSHQPRVPTPCPAQGYTRGCVEEGRQAGPALWAAASAGDARCGDRNPLPCSLATGVGQKAQPSRAWGARGSCWFLPFKWPPRCPSALPPTPPFLLTSCHAYRGEMHVHANVPKGGYRPKVGGALRINVGRPLVQSHHPF